MNFAEAVIRLRAAGVASPERDAQKLSDFANADAARFEGLIERRIAREPVSQIIGKRAFWTSEFEVTGDVLDPRPDTETLVEAALAAQWKSVLDLGTGSGCILLSLLKERNGCTGTGVDISKAALAVAARNRERLGLAASARLLQSDWFETVTGRYDLIVSNPPYIAEHVYQGLPPELVQYEPRIALTPGGDGLAAYRIIAANASHYLTVRGQVMVEIGYDQGESVQEIFRAAGFVDISLIRDLAGKDRVVRAQLSAQALNS